MRTLSGLDALGDWPRARGCAATVGVFDGVHLGHFVVLRRVVTRAAELGFEAAVVTFANHPKNVLLGRAPATITSLDHRLLLFERIGLNVTLVLEFTPELRDYSAADFVGKILLEGLGMRELILGFDSKLGKDRRGTIESLAPLAAALGFGLEEVPPLRLGGRAVSSTAVREAVQLGELERAAAMLGRPVSVLGKVVRGDGRGRDMGFATANLDLFHELRPPQGVYAALVYWQAKLWPAVVNIGTRPTFGDSELTIEVHLLDFSGDLYGAALEVFFLERIRPEQGFPDAARLKAQIQRDVARGREIAAAAPRKWRIPGPYLPIEGPGAAELAAGPGPDYS